MSARVLAAIGLLSLLPPSVAAAPSIHAVVGPARKPFEPRLSAKVLGDRSLVAFHYAPIHYQTVDRSGKNGLDGQADYVTRVDFDGDWDARNDWENAARFPLPGAVYYSVVETESHWFVVYMFFHPRDWADSLFDTEHENDSEGVLVVVARDASRFGRLQAAVTVAHSDFFSFVPAEGRWSAGDESVDGVIELDGGRPLTTQEAKGHALRAFRRDSRFAGVVYVPSLAAASPPNPGDKSASYVLLDLVEAGGIWQRRDDPRLFANPGSFAGDRSDGCGSGGIRCNENAAHAPWGWDDSDDGDVQRGDIATDPVRLVTRYFRAPERISGEYTYNPYTERSHDMPLLAKASRPSRR